MIPFSASGVEIEQSEPRMRGDDPTPTRKVSIVLE